ncbi:unnamed protein product [Brugia pahangi]|uniref:C2H2-type domain-containing protein n=1 Tax=Brugia pahangi TaxID=6280 RepID=A0A0N4TEL2_BRUPA|nr:unnamed protein product [Brugia pahangi]
MILHIIPNHGLYINVIYATKFLFRLKKLKIVNEELNCASCAHKNHMSRESYVSEIIICLEIHIGLQQHAVIHTDQKPFGCDICGKAFRFKSNLFEHRSVHSGFTPHACPYCGKTCRLKGNLKKHLKTHVSTKEELEEAWKPFAR